MLYTVAAFHDLAHYINKDKHEVLSAQIFYENEKMTEFFSPEERLLMKEAIIDHRASLEYIPRNDYGKILSSADRSTDISELLRRTHAVFLPLTEFLSVLAFDVNGEFETGSTGYTHKKINGMEAGKWVSEC